MSKHRNKKHRNPEQENVTQNSPINFDNITQMLNNIDQEQIMSLMSSLNINPQSFQQNTQQNVQQNFDEDEEIQDAQTNNTNTSVNRSTNIDSNDPGVKLVNAIRPLMAPDKIQILDRILEIYNSGAFDNIK